MTTPATTLTCRDQEAQVLHEPVDEGQPLDADQVLVDLERRLGDTSRRLRRRYRLWLGRTWAVVGACALGAMAVVVGMFVWWPLAFVGFTAVVTGCAYAAAQQSARQRRMGLSPIGERPR
jgi:hypothetical protein